MTKYKKKEYEEGDWFAVPLRNGGQAIGLVVRANKDGIILGYFFGPRFVTVPTLDDVRDIKSAPPILVRRFGHLGLISGEWTIIGKLPEWAKDKWPTPAFCRYEELTGRSFKVTYDDDDPNRVTAVDEITPGIAEQLPKDGLSGAGAIERKLTALLS